jgi:predicted nuclease with RNAse H fold
MRKKLTVIGLDLAGVPGRPSGACRLVGWRAATTLLFTDEEIMDYVRGTGPALVAIDAPLNLPPGRRSMEDRNGLHYRPCDLDLRRRKIPFFPITLGPMRGLTERGIRLKLRLEAEGIRAVEIYPGGAQDIWGLPRARRDAAGLRSGLTRLGIQDLKKNVSDHELDAASGALVGRLFLLRKAEVLGDFATGAIIMPKGPIGD